MLSDTYILDTNDELLYNVEYPFKVVFSHRLTLPFKLSLFPFLGYAADVWAMVKPLSAHRQFVQRLCISWDKISLLPLFLLSNGSMSLYVSFFCETTGFLRFPQLRCYRT